MLNTIHHLGTMPHNWLLYALVRELEPVALVEVGAWQGFSTCWVARALADLGWGHLHVVDINACQDIGVLYENLKRTGLQDWVTVIEGDSREILNSDLIPQQIDFAFVDGNHDYEYVSADVEALRQRMNPGSCLVMHDIFHDQGPYRKYREMKRDWKGWDFLEIPASCGLGVARWRSKPEWRGVITEIESDYPWE